MVNGYLPKPQGYVTKEVMTNNTQSTSQEWTIKRLLDWTCDYFEKFEIEEPRLTAEMLLAHVLDIQRIELYVKFDEVPTTGQMATYKSLMQRAAKHEPVSYLTGTAHFFSLSFKVNSHTLIPRPETEGLVMRALAFLKTLESSNPTALDLCTGSGCVAAAIAQNNKSAKVTALDISKETCEVASENITAIGLDTQVTVIESDLFNALDSNACFNIITANPPYINTQEYQALDKNVKDFEPELALHAGTDGLDVIRNIIIQSKDRLQMGGKLIMEIAWNQSEQVQQLMQESQWLSEIKTIKDEQGHERIIEGMKTS